MKTKPASEYKVRVKFAGDDQGKELLAEARKYVYYRLVKKVQKSKGAAKNC